MRNAILPLGFVAASAALGCTPFEGDGSGSTSSSTTTGAGAGGGSSAQSSSASGMTTTGAGGGNPTLETVTVVDAAGNGQPSLTVFSSKPDGALAASVMTDGGGSAKLDVPAGGSVSFVDPVALRVTTYLGLQDGASVRFVRAEARANANAPKPFSVTTPPVYAGSNTHEISTSCIYAIGAFGNGVTTSLQATGCPGQSTFDAVVVALGVKPSPTDLGPVLGTVTKTFPYSATAMNGFTVGPATVGRLRSDTTVPSGAVSAKLRVTGRKAGVRLYFRESDMSSGSLVEMPNNAFDAFDAEQTVLFSKVGATQPGRRHLEHYAQLPATAKTITLPASPIAPTMSADADPTAGTLTFGLSGTPFADALVLDATQPQGAWTVVLPPAASGTVTLPTLPSGFDAQKLVPSTAQNPLVYTVSHVDDSAATSFAGLLANGWAFDGETLDASMVIHAY